jgi:protein-export membrane protein SecD
MKKIGLFIMVWIAFWGAIPWKYIWLEKLDYYLGDYKLGLDLHGGIELDYLVDFPTDMDQSRRSQAIEDMKTILDWRVRRVGTTEPILNTAQYGNETHIIVQIPTPSENDHLSPKERKIKDNEFIQEAKSIIGQVVKMQFKEPRTEQEFNKILEDREAVKNDIKNSFYEKEATFDVWWQKMADSYENVFLFKSGDLVNFIWNNLTFETLQNELKTSIPNNNTNQIISELSTITVGSKKGIGFISLSSLDGTPISNTSPVSGQLVFIDDEPLRYKPAIANNGKALDEKYLINTIPNTDSTTGQYVVSLIFNTEGQKMFGDITEKNAGGVIAIFLWNQLLTAPHVSWRIDGNAIITPGNESDSKAWATLLSKKINEGIVPIGIYEHSERTIGPNLGKTSLKQLVISGIIGWIFICAFLLWRYGISGVVASISLILYVILLLALVRFMGVTLTLSWVAGIVLSLGVAIDSNILLLERVKDFLHQWKDTESALKLGFREAWSAVWDSNLTGLLVGIILWWMWVSLVKGFGQMTVLGIIVSLWVVKFICNPLTIWLKNKTI